MAKQPTRNATVPPRRSTVMEAKGITTKELEDAYQELESIYKVAERFDISTATVSRNLRHIPKHNRRGPPKRTGQLTEWKRQHPEVNLPLNDPRQLAEITGCSYRAVTSELYRRRLRFRKRLKKHIVQQMRHNKTLTTVEGQTVSVRDIHSLILPKKLPFIRDVIVKVELKGSSKPVYVEFHYPGAF